MGQQRIDDTVRRLPKVWLGPSGSWRWPFDARYSAWAMWFAMTGPVIIVLGLMIPVGLIIAGAAWYGGRAVTARTEDSRLRWVFVAAFVLFCALLLAPSVWLLPMPFLLAVVVGPIVSVLITRALMRHVDYDRPVRYWVGLIRALRDAPRPTRPPAEYRVHTLPETTETRP